MFVVTRLRECCDCMEGLYVYLQPVQEYSKLPIVNTNSSILVIKYHWVGELYM